MMQETAWQWAKKLYKNRGTHLENEGFFFKPKLELAVASTSTVNPDDIELIYCWFPRTYVNEEQDEFITKRIWNNQSVSTSHDSDHGEWVDRHKRGGCSLRETLGHVRHGLTPWGHSSGIVSGNLCEENGFSYEW